MHDLVEGLEWVMHDGEKDILMPCIVQLRVFYIAFYLTKLFSAQI